MKHLIDLERYPLERPGSVEWSALVGMCKSRLARDGLFNLEGFITPDVLRSTVEELTPTMQTQAFTHARQHNIYFKKNVEGIAASHPALQMFETSNRTICADQMGQAAVIQLYEWSPFIRFLAAVMGKTALFTMDDPLARVNVMGYGQGQALNWHFDRAEFTTTLLLQAPEQGGMFEYDQDLRCDNDPNYDGVADLLAGRRMPTRMPVTAGTLNVFKGKNTAHRVTPVRGKKDRIIAVFSYFDHPGVLFSKEDRMGFYGRVS